MSTRAVYTFKDREDTFNVYKHHDGYPEGALSFIKKATLYAWELPRFEPDEFGASFIAANKDGEGSVRLTSDFKRHGDLAYRYEITLKDENLFVKIYGAKDWSLGGVQKYKLEDSGFLDDLIKSYKIATTLSNVEVSQ